MRRVLALLLALLAATPALAGCLTDGPAPPDGDTPPPAVNRTLRFDGDRARDWVAAQVAWPDGTPRYRVPGTPGRAAVADLVAENLSAMGWTVTRQRWTGTYLCEDVRLENVLATLPGRTDRVLLLSAHYDTRPWADADPDTGARDEPVLGANDGGSGVGALLELARVLAEQPTLNHTVRLAFFDAEDGGNPPSFAACDENAWIIGSTHFAQELTEAEVDRVEAAINLDMVGDANLTLQRERFSARPPHRALQDHLWSTGAALGYGAFQDVVDGSILDDHRPLQDRGIPAVDVIHLDEEGSTVFPATWHTRNDTMAHVSAASLEAVGRTVEQVLYDLDAQLDAGSTS